METKQVWGICAECGRYHKNPVKKVVKESDFEDDVAALLEYSEELQSENKELNALVEILQRELHDARQMIDNLNLQLRISELEKELAERKSAKFDAKPWNESEEELEESLWLHNVYSVGHR